jgi:hypothetical protein
MENRDHNHGGRSAVDLGRGQGRWGRAWTPREKSAIDQARMGEGRRPAGVVAPWEGSEEGDAESSELRLGAGHGGGKLQPDLGKERRAPRS